MADSTLGNLADATAATGGLFYGTQAGNDCKFTSTSAGAALLEAADVTAQQTLLEVLPLTGGSLTGSVTIGGGGYDSVIYGQSSIQFQSLTYTSQLVADSSSSSAVTNTLPAAGGVILNDNSALAVANLTGTIAAANLGSGTASSSTYLRGNNTFAALPTTIQLACSDETTALTVGTSKAVFRMPYAMTLTGVRASVTTAPTGSTLIVNIKENGTTILSTLLSIDATEKTSTTAATPAVISDSALADDSEITIDITQIGSTVAGAGLKVTLIGTRA